MVELARLVAVGDELVATLVAVVERANSRFGADLSSPDKMSAVRQWRRLKDQMKTGD